MDGFKKIVKMKIGGLVKTPVTGDKKAEAPSKAAVKPSFLGSDVAKEKNKPAGTKDFGIKSKESDKAADVPSAAIKGRKAKAAGTVSKFKCGGNVKKMAVGGSALNDLMQAKELARLANARKYLGAGQQGQFAGQEAQQTPAMTGLPTAPAPDPAPAPVSAPPMKKGGKAKKDKC